VRRGLELTKWFGRSTWTIAPESSRDGSECHQARSGPPGLPLYLLQEGDCRTLGQVLYLEAEEAGIRATGIGCYFDDAVHEVFGIDSRTAPSVPAARSRANDR
jgi:hypothetical protein